MKRKWTVVAFAAACAIALAGCSGIVKPPLIAVENVTLNKSEHWLARGAEFQLVATVTPDNAYDTTVTWSSSNNDVATVDKNGLVTARNEGYVRITAQAGEKTAVCEIYVYVYNPSVSVESISIYPNPLTLDVGDWEQLGATVLPPEANSGSVKWESDDDSIAEVLRFENDVYVQAKKPGKTTIYASMGGKTATCAVTVNGVSLNKTYLPLMVGEGEQLTAKAMLNGVPVEDIRWESSYESVATVDEFGYVFAKGGGATDIYAYVDGFEPAICRVAVSGITLNGSNLSLKKGEEFELKATVTRNGLVDNVEVRWRIGTSSNESEPVVMIEPGINNDCKVMANAEGETTIYASADDYPIAECKVTVSSQDVGNDDDFVMDENGTLTKYNGTDSTVAIPEGVKMIGREAFKDCTNLTIVEIPVGVEYIYWGAFEGCMNLKTVKYGGTLANWCAMNNDDSNLMEKASSVILSDVENLKDLTKLDIPNNVLSIGNNAFNGCVSLTTVNIHSDIIQIGFNAFNGCENINVVNYDGTLSQWCSMENDFGLMSNAGSVKVGGKDLKTLDKLEIPEDVAYIANNAFCYCEGLREVTISNDVNVIGQYAFAECTSLQSVVIPGNVKYIWVGAFDGCANLNKVTIYDGVKDIGDYVFHRCSELYEVTIPVSVTNIGNNAFADCDALVTVNYTGNSTQWNSINSESDYEILRQDLKAKQSTMTMMVQILLESNIPFISTAT